MNEPFLAERNRVLALLSIYEPLLTDKQREAVDDYYRFDLSLGEISEETGTSRAAVSDAIKKTIAKLEEFDSRLGLLAKKEAWAKRAKEASLLPGDQQADAYRTLTEDMIHGL